MNKKERNNVLNDMSRCCGCGLCEINCPVKAISMQYGKDGFIYPVIDQSKCINCSLCEKKCSIIKASVQRPLLALAGVNKSDRQRRLSASGGIFAALAANVLERGGAVFGAAVVEKENGIQIKHICIEEPDLLYKLQGSKYVQSNIRDCFGLVKKHLEDNRYVLFSGTPCQVAAIKSYLKKPYPNLLMVDLICHGVPSEIFLQEELKTITTKNHGKAIDINFRSSGYLKGHVTLETSKGIEQIPFDLDGTYLRMFLECNILRDSCHQCPFASRKRCGDITIGDFWGFEKEFDIKELEERYQIKLDEGISLMLANSQTGVNALQNISEKIWEYVVPIEMAVKHNPQLQMPTPKGKSCKIIQILWKIFGWNGIVWFNSLKTYFRKK